MKWVIVGLGNPGEEYEHTRHNAGFMAVEHFAQKIDADDWKEDKKANARVTKGMLGKDTAVFVLPLTYMNNSGSATARFISGPKAAKNLIVVHDDMDLPLGKMKVSFGKNSGGHKGVESVMRAVKTKEFVRIRIGVSPETKKGVAKKQSGEDAVLKFIVGKFKPSEEADIKKILSRTDDALHTIITEGIVPAMNKCNQA